MTVRSSELNQKNQFLQTTYNRKCMIQYDRLLLVLNNNIPYVRTTDNIFQFIAGAVLSVSSFLITILTAEFTEQWEWTKHLLLTICVLAFSYYLFYILKLVIKGKTTEDIIFELEKDNELDENNKKKRQ